MKGLVVGVRCGMYAVLVDGVIYHAPARGLFRNRHTKVMVGDWVFLDARSLVIQEVLPRTSLLMRPSIANATQIMVVLSLVEPEFSYELAYKYLTYAHIHGIQSKLIITKVDQVNDQKYLKEIKEIFMSSGIECYFISNKTKEGIEQIKNLFANQITCLMGQTGVGKSSLLNTIDTNFERDIGEYSRALGRGKHQTKEVVLLPYQQGYIADTPGFSSLDLEISGEDLAKYFPGFMDYALKCFFSNCLHDSEPKCAIKVALEEGKIHPVAYRCYLKLLKEIKEEK